MTADAISDRGAVTPSRDVRAGSGRTTSVLVAASAIFMSATVVAALGYTAGRWAAATGPAPTREARAEPRTASDTTDERAAAETSAPPIAPRPLPGAESGAAAIATSNDTPHEVADGPAPSAADGEGGGSRLAGLGGDLSQLHPKVAEAVIEARRQRIAAEAAERRAQRAAARARDGGDNVLFETFDNGDVYAGEAVDGVRQGVGVYTWANSIEGVYAGEFRDGAIAGLGVKRWADGAAYFGSRSPEAREGHGVFAYAEGGGYEGEWKMGAPDGYGVVWTPDGRVQSQGRWASNVLVEEWVVPADEAADGEEGADSAGEPRPVPADDAAESDADQGADEE